MFGLRVHVPFLTGWTTWKVEAMKVRGWRQHVATVSFTKQTAGLGIEQNAGPRCGQICAHGLNTILDLKLYFPVLAAYVKTCQIWELWLLLSSSQLNSLPDWGEESNIKVSL